VSWQAEAETLGDDARGIGLAAALTVAQARAARVDPEATRSLISAALTLGAEPARFWQHAEPVRSEADMIEAAETLASDAWELARIAADLHDKAIIARDAADRAARDADRAERESGTTAETRDARGQAINEAADADTAAEIAAGVAIQLDHAVHRLDDIPGDLHETYEAVHDHLARGRVLPYDGDFLTPLTRRGTA
jgi:hypothetical protein